MKVAKVLGGLALAALAIFAFGRFFLSQLSGAGGGAMRPAGPSAVIHAAPPGWSVEERGELSRREAARALADRLAGSPAADKLGLHFTDSGDDLYWLADRAGDSLEELSLAASGTQVSTLWRGAVARRLAWAAANDGDPAAPGLPEPERRNLYH